MIFREMSKVYALILAYR